MGIHRSAFCPTNSHHTNAKKKHSIFCTEVSQNTKQKRNQLGQLQDKRFSLSIGPFSMSAPCLLCARYPIWKKKCSQALNRFESFSHSRLNDSLRGAP